MVAGLTLAVTVGFAGEARAALIGCGPGDATDLTGRVTNAAGTATAAADCQYLSPADNSNVASISNINTAGFFGFTDWESNGQNQLDDDTGASGTWSVANVDFATYDYILVFKDGHQTNLTAFLLNELYSSGAWTTPFTEPPFEFSGGSTVHGVSHYTVARRLADSDGGDGGGDTTIPEPASLLLLGMGAILGGRRARRRFAA